MKKNKALSLVVGILLVAHCLKAQVGFYDAPYTRYEADLGTLSNAPVLTKSYKQSDLQSEASDQVCVDLSAAGASVNWTVAADGDGLVVRYSVPDGQTSLLNVYADNVLVGTLTLTTYYSWEYLSTNGNPNNVGISNTNPRMRFDEVRMKLPSKILTGGNLKLVRQSGTIYLDFAELEPVPASTASSAGDAIYSGDGSTLQTFIDANGGKTIYVPAGVYNVNRELYFVTNNTILKGAGMWDTEIHFTGNGTTQFGGLTANATDVSFSNLYLSTSRNSRTNSYKAINGVFTSGSTITNVWAEHFECGAWIAQYNPGSIAIADGFTLSYCRFRNNYADGINLCKGTSNSIVEHCSFRNNGDDDMAIWCSNNQECQNNTFRYSNSENCWRASGCAIYGGLSNQAHHLLIKDNLEVGLRVNNSFSGTGFNSGGMHVFSNITIVGCGTFNDLYNTPVGAIDVSASDVAGTRIKNVKFSNITITDSRNDAIYIYRKNGEGFYNLIFENISINGTGKEYPNNNAKGLNWGRGYGILFVGNPSGYGTYCNMTYANIGGNAGININNSQIGTFSWISAGCGTVVLSPLSGATFGECDPVITITGDALVSNGAIDSIEFFVDGAKVGADVSAPYSYDLHNFTLGSHQVYVKSTHEPSGTTISSTAVVISVEYFKGLISSATAPAIDGVAESLWNGYTAEPIEKNSVGNFIGTADLSANYKITYDLTNLYILVDVTDDVLVNDGGNNWDNDALELFIDIGNNKSGSYGANDYNYNFVYNNPTVFETKHGATTGVTFAQSLKTGGYLMEISIPWSTLSTSAIATGALMGFDLHVDDDDNGGTRDAKIAWADCADVAWNNPSVFGTLQESGCTTTVAPAGFINFQASTLSGETFLNWDTYYKENDDHFDIQRDDTGTGNFQLISTQGASGTPGSLSAKSYTDYSPPAGMVSYRIAQIDADGCKILSDTISLSIATGILQNQENGGFNFYPNPFQGSGELQINTNNASGYSISIKDMSGMVLSTKNLTGTGSYPVGGNLSPGMYILEIFDGNTRQAIKLVKL